MTAYVPLNQSQVNGCKQMIAYGCTICYEVGSFINCTFSNYTINYFDSPQEDLNFTQCAKHCCQLDFNSEIFQNIEQTFVYTRNYYLVTAGITYISLIILGLSCLGFGMSYYIFDNSTSRIKKVLKNHGLDVIFTIPFMNSFQMSTFITIVYLIFKGNKQIEKVRIQLESEQALKLKQDQNQDQKQKQKQQEPSKMLYQENDQQQKNKLQYKQKNKVQIMKQFSDDSDSEQQQQKYDNIRQSLNFLKQSEFNKQQKQQQGEFKIKSKSPIQQIYTQYSGASHNLTQLKRNRRNYRKSPGLQFHDSQHIENSQIKLKYFDNPSSLDKFNQNQENLDDVFDNIKVQQTNKKFYEQQSQKSSQKNI